jgi:hypothetical protein
MGCVPSLQRKLSDCGSQTPLEERLGKNRCVGFLYMGRVNGINLYKHGIARMYLNLDVRNCLCNSVPLDWLGSRPANYSFSDGASAESMNTVSAASSSKHRFTLRPPTGRVRCTIPAGSVAHCHAVKLSMRPSARSISKHPSTTRKSSSDLG